MGRIRFTGDIWSDNHQSHLCIIRHWLVRDPMMIGLQLKSALLVFHHLHGGHDGKSMAAIVIHFLDWAGIIIWFLTVQLPWPEGNTADRAPYTTPQTMQLLWRNWKLVFTYICDIHFDCYDSYRLHTNSSLFPPTLTSPCFIFPTLVTHHSHTYFTLLHTSHTCDSLFPHWLHYDTSTPIVPLLYIRLGTHL